jgi:hypothetical protein
VSDQAVSLSGVTRFSYPIRLLSVRSRHGSSQNILAPIKSIRCNSSIRDLIKINTITGPLFYSEQNLRSSKKRNNKQKISRTKIVNYTKGIETGRNRHFKAGWLPNSLPYKTCWTAICSPMMRLTAVIPAYESVLPRDCGEGKLNIPVNYYPTVAFQSAWQDS